MKARAVAKYIKGSPQKARLVIDLIRGRSVNEALAMLKTLKKRAAKPIEITLRSAIANASQKADQLNVAIDVDRLKISNATVDLGPTKYRRRVLPHNGPRLSRAPLADHNDRGGIGKRVTVRVSGSWFRLKSGRGTWNSDRNGGIVGQKVHPYGFRLGSIARALERIAKRDYADLLHEA